MPKYTINPAALKDYLIIALFVVIIFLGFNNYLYARSGRSGNNAGLLSLGGGCCGDGTAVVSQEELRQTGLYYYASVYNDSEVEAVVKDFGCHQEIHIYKDGLLIKRLAYAYGEIYEL